MLNKVQFIGHLGRDPEVRYLPNGDAVCNFSVASTERWKDKSTGEMQERTEWLRCNAFAKLAEICGQYLLKGSLVYVEGSLQTRKWVDKESGQEKFATECKLVGMKMLGGKAEGAEGGAQGAGRPATASPGRAAPAASSRSARPAAKPAAAATGTGFDDMDDDIPF